jgi:hypothetical protein
MDLLSSSLCCSCSCVYLCCKWLGSAWMEKFLIVFTLESKLKFIDLEIKVRTKWKECEGENFANEFYLSLSKFKQEFLTLERDYFDEKLCAYLSGWK